MPDQIYIHALLLVFWLFIVTLSSYLLTEGANELASWLGPVFVGRIVLSIVTTFPEIAIVIAAVNSGLLDAALGASIGSNLLMITLGLSLVALVATTSVFSPKPVKEFPTTEFRSDAWFLGGTAILSLILVIHGIAIISGIVFIAVFAYYAYHAYSSNAGDFKKIDGTLKDPTGTIHQTNKFRAALLMLLGGAGVMVSSELFVHELAMISFAVGVPLAALSLVISPIAGEMPEKISLILLARKGIFGLRIAVANILGSKVVNNTLLLGIFALFSALEFGAGVVLVSSTFEIFQLALVALITILALGTVLRTITRRKAILLISMYAIAIVLQFVIP